MTRCKHGWSDSSGWGPTDDNYLDHCRECTEEQLQDNLRQRALFQEKRNESLLKPYKDKISSLESEVADLKFQLDFVTTILAGLEEELFKDY